MSKREEIKEKQALQMKLQAQFNQLDQTVMGWLNGSGVSSSTLTPTAESDKGTFEHQQVVEQGKGLNFDEEQMQVGQFMSNTTGKPSLNSKVKLGLQSKSLTALQNKLRSDSRREGGSRVTKERPKKGWKDAAVKDKGKKMSKAQGKGQAKANDGASASASASASDSDSDAESEEAIRQIRSKGKPNSKRPF
ncbi:hypothetical protein DAMA08_044180 [Martiniozyma asiatica (nom. inval.)]|nr:hypothetical protein DAMA08_044180 [Martiniozyma asiatica]